MNKKVRILVFIIIMSLSLSACSSQAKPEDTVGEFIEAMKNFDLELMQSKINPNNLDEEEEIFDLNEEDNLFEKDIIEYIESNAKKITYEINESEVDGEKAVVDVDVKYVDGAPLFQATFMQYLEKVFGLAFTQGELTDEENAEIFINAMEEQKEIVEETFSEKSLKFECVKIDDEWYIDDLSDEMLDVATSNFLSVAEGIGDSFDEPDTSFEETEEEANIIEKNIGDEVTLATIKFKVNGVEEVSETESTFGSTSAKEDAKFVLIDIDVTNITNSEFDLPDAFILTDNQGREFSTYSDSIGGVDNYIEYRNLSPSIKENGYLMYELPEDASNYSIVIAKAETNDVYEVILK